MRINDNGDAIGNYTLLIRQKITPNRNTSDKLRYYPVEYALNVAAHFEDDHHKTSLPVCHFYLAHTYLVHVL